MKKFVVKKEFSPKENPNVIIPVGEYKITDWDWGNGGFQFETPRGDFYINHEHSLLVGKVVVQFGK